MPKEKQLRRHLKSNKIKVPIKKQKYLAFVIMTISINSGIDFSVIPVQRADHGRSDHCNQYCSVHSSHFPLTDKWDFFFHRWI